VKAGVCCHRKQRRKPFSHGPLEGRTDLPFLFISVWYVMAEAELGNREIVTEPKYHVYKGKPAWQNILRHFDISHSADSAMLTCASAH